MNIFFLSRNPKKCAKYHCDKHVVKMILELCQMLFAAHHFSQPNTKWQETLLPQEPYKKTHQNHPMCQWVRADVNNYKFTLKIFHALCQEYSLRYKREHASFKFYKWLSDNIPPCDSSLIVRDENNPKYVASKILGCTRIPLCMSEIFYNKNLIKAYRDYYRGDKRKFAVWWHSKTPKWWIED